MIDGTDTYNLIADPENLIKNPFLADFWDTIVHNSDGVIKRGFAVYMGMKFNITYNKVRLQGSLHKYRNEGRHNYDNFTSLEVAKVVQELQERFEIDIYKTFLNNVEFGVNVVLPFGVHVVLDNLITYKGKHFERFVDKGISYYQCKLSKFIIKIYDKGKQYNLPDNVLRFEIKVTAMQYLEKRDIKLRYLSDLLNMDIYEPLGNTLTEVFEEILFGDNTINESDLTGKELTTYLRGSNPKAWTPQKGEKERKRLQRLEHEFKSILERHRTGVNFRSMVSDLIRAKSLELSQISQNLKVEYNVLTLGLFPYLSNEKRQFVPNINFIYNRPLGQGTKPKTKLCSGCGKPIEPKRLYHSLECKIRRDERNARSNDRNNFKKKIKKLVSKPSLFDVMALVKLTSQQKKWLGE